MGSKFSEKELLKIAESGLEDMSCEQIKQLIQKESNKDYSDINTDFLDLCFNMLAMKQNRMPLFNENYKTKSSNLRVKRVLIFAAVVMAFFVTTLTVSASVFHFNIPKEISYWVENRAKTDINYKFADTTADGYLLENSQLGMMLKKQGITPITLPGDMINEKCKIIKIDNITTDKAVSTDLYVEFKYGEAFGSLCVSQYADYFEWKGEIIEEDVLSADMIKANGMDILVFESNDGCTIRYKDNKTTYEIYIETDFETAISFAKSTK